MILKFRYKYEKDPEKIINWEVFADAYNNKYFFCSETQSTAFFVNDGTMFYFTSFYGSRKSLLYFFYITAYKVLLGYYEHIELTDIVPLHVIRRNMISLWINDIIAPFYQFLRVQYSIRPVRTDSSVNPSYINLSSGIYISYFSTRKEEGSGNILLSENQLSEFEFKSSKSKIWAQRIDL
jgi:hypothetical protein